MSAIVRETSEYVEMSDSITLCIVKDGAAGSDAVTYGVQVTPTYETWSDAKNHAGIALMFTKTTGSTMLKYWNVQVLGTAKVYVDGTELEDLNKWVNGGNNKIIFDSFTFDGTNNTPTIGTASVISIELIVDDKIVATANYANGKQGADGKGAMEIIVAPDILVFDTDDDGIVPSGTSKTATIACYRDGKKVTNVEYDLTEGGHPDCAASISTSNNTATVTISSIAKDETYGVSKTSGTVEVQVHDKDNGRYYFPTVKFSVNVAKFNDGLKADNKRLESKYTELSNKSATKDELKQYDSKIEQTARNIKFEVMEKSVGRRNLLPGSAFRKQGEGCSIVQDGQDAINGICINGGYDGVNCARLRNEGNAGAAYPRISWDGARNSNVKVAKGKKYTLSFWAKRLSSTEGGYEISTQFFLQNGANGSDRPYHALKMGSFTVKSQGEWEFIQDTVTIPSDVKSNYVEVCICLGLYQRGMAEILVCRPMLEEGEEYNGWTLSEQDYDYVGGNLLDGTATLAKTGNVEVLDGTVTQDGMGESASIKAELPPTGTYVDFLQFSTANMGLKANEDYTLSFYAKTEGNAGKLQCYLYPSDGDINTEDSESGYDNSYAPSDGSLQSEIVPGTRWKRYWVHWRPTKADPKHVLFRLMRGGNDRGTYSSYTTYAVDDVVLYDGTYYRCIMAGQGNTPSSSSSYWDAAKYQISLSQPKLEVGATMTEWTAKRSDMVDKQALYATGIDIDSKKITLTADKTYVQSNSGEPIAMFSASGGFINSDILNVKHVYAKDANGTVYGHFGYEDATGGTSSSGKKYPLWLGAETCDRAPFAVSSSGDMYANSGMLGPFSIGGYGISSPSFSTGTGMSLGFLITLTGATFNSNNNNYDMAAVIGGHTAYGDPLSYLTGGGDYSDPTYRDFSTSFGYGTMRARQSLYVRKKLDSSSSPSTSVDIHGWNQTGGKPYAAMIVDSDCMGVNSPSSNFFGGMACGLLRVSSVSGTNLAAWDENRVTTLVMTNSSRETVPLPKYPEVGQMIWVIQQGGIVYFSSDNSHPIKTANGTGSTVTSGANSNKKGQINLFVWDGQYWNCSYINGGLF